MHDIKQIRDAPDLFDAGLTRRGLPAMARTLLDLDARRRAAQAERDQLQARRSQLSRAIGEAKKAGHDALSAVADVAAIKDRMAALEAVEAEAAQALDAQLAVIPNLPAADVPDGAGEADNVERRRGGEVRVAIPGLAAPLEHFDIGEGLGLMDFEAAARLSGARFVVLRSALARLERALAAFMLDLHTTEFGYQELYVPTLVKGDALYGTGQLPKFADDLFRTATDHWLIPTAEVSLTNLVAGQILDQANLPLRYTAYTPCFRLEAGAAGRDTRGMMRQHQFGKVELVSITTPDDSDAEQERMTACAEEVLRRLGLAWRVLALCTGDMGFSARRTYDLEVWLPGQGRYREISSCSSCGDFQARRMNARFRAEGDAKGTRFVHTLNGSGVAVGRALIAVLETYQTAAGDVVVPEVLRPYMGGLDRIKAVEHRV